MRHIAPFHSATGSLGACCAALLLLSGCFGASPTETVPAGTGDGDVPIVAASFEILNLHGTTQDPNSDGTCQTGAGIELRAFEKAADGSVGKQSHDPQGQPVSFSWKDEVDFGDGVRHPSFDWGLGEGDNIITTDELEISRGLYTIAVHYVTLTVKTRDGRSASHEFRITVTACEDCGTEG